MTKDDIIRMAKEAGFARTKMHGALERFANLVAKAEREACAKVCEAVEVPDVIYGAHPDYLEGKFMAISQAATAIRARGQQ